MQPITIIDRRRRERAAPAAPERFTHITERAAVAAVEAFFRADQDREGRSSLAGLVPRVRGRAVGARHERVDLR